MSLKKPLILLSVIFFSLSASASAEYRINGLEKYLSQTLLKRNASENRFSLTAVKRWEKHFQSVRTNSPAEFHSESYFSTSFTENFFASDLSDFKVNVDNFTSTFTQKNSDIIIFSNKSFLVVWEDERNGDLDIFAQRFDSLGNRVGSEFIVNPKIYPVDQYLPKASVDRNNRVVITWVDYVALDIYAQRYDANLNPIGAAIKVNDSSMKNTAFRPAVASSPNGNFVIVWEDFRSGNNILGQRYDSLGTALGTSFIINSDPGLLLHLAPKVDLDPAGNFVVTWEDYRTGEADIYFRRYNSSGLPLDTNVIASVDTGNFDQFQPDIDVNFSGNFAITWVDMRTGNEDIFHQRFNSSGIPLGSQTQVNSDVGLAPQWNPQIDSDSLGDYRIFWSDFRSFPAIYFQKYLSTGSPLGSNLQFSDPGLKEKDTPSLATHKNGKFVVSWSDYRNDNFDIFARRGEVNDLPSGLSFRVNNDLQGAQQKNSQIVSRSSNPDIYYKIYNPLGNILRSETKVNDDTVSSLQQNPALGMTPSGNFVMTWQDSRSGDNHIFAQRFDSLGNPLGLNFQVDDDTLTSQALNPDVAYSKSGNFVVVWSDDRVGSVQNIYGQLFQSGGSKTGTNFKLNDDLVLNNHITPKAGMDSSGNFTVAWYDTRDGQEHIYIQRYNSSGSKVGTNVRVVSDSLNTSQFDLDLEMNHRGEWVITWIENWIFGKVLLAQRYNSSGNPVGSNLRIVDNFSYSPESPEIALDDSGSVGVCWIDYRLNEPNLYSRFYYPNNDSLGSDFRINSDPGNNAQLVPDIALSRNTSYYTWMDNRIPDVGYDVFARSIFYKGTSVAQNSKSNLPHTFELFQNYPNPFNSSTVISYSLRTNSFVNLKIYNLLGQLVKTLVSENQTIGNHKITWDGKDGSGNDVSSGVYFYQLKAKDFTSSRKMVLIK